jgi:uncharacterized membrane protein YeaQ/YmgE (transglycosylase-associated protein family)
MFSPCASRRAPSRHYEWVNRLWIGELARIRPLPGMTGATKLLHPAHFQQEESMNLLIWLVVGGVIGWIASMIMKTDAQQGVLLNVVVGIIGAMLGGWLISPLLGVGTINQNNFSIGALVVSLVGAVILLAIVNLFRRGSVR